MILVLAGTSDGREIVKTLVSAGHRVLACAATPYGASLLEGSGAVGISGRPLCESEIDSIIHKNKIKILVDATHPYAEKISALAFEICREKGVRYIRYQRPASTVQEHPLIFYAKSYVEAAEKAAGLGEVIFLTTGSKTLQIFVEAAKKKGRRVVARLLPQPDVLAGCFSQGLTPADIVAMQGPFGLELNTALLRHYKADVLVTKDGGVPGGMEEKLSAALQLGIPVVVVGRPETSPGAVSDITELLEEVRGV